jgi:hypothetical protein
VESFCAFCGYAALGDPFKNIAASSVVKILRFAETLFQFCAFCASSRLKDPFPPRVISG